VTDRLAIGGNSPPLFDAYTMALDDAYDTAKDFLDGSPIENQGQADAVGKIVSEVKKLKRDADAARAEEKRPHDDAAKAVQAKWKPLLDRADTIITAAQKPLTAYLNKLAEKQAEAERIAREEADRKAQEAIAAARALTTADGGIDALERVQEMEREAEDAAKAAAIAAKEKPLVAGMDRRVGLRTYNYADVADYRLLLEHVMKHDPEPLKAWLADYAQRALPMRLPGVIVRTEKRVA
jgi:hypothetical protein